MMNQEMATRLEHIAAEIESIEVQLNDNSHTCATCGLTVRENFSEHKNREILAGLRQRIKRIVGSFWASK